MREGFRVIHDLIYTEHLIQEVVISDEPMCLCLMFLCCLVLIDAPDGCSFIGEKQVGPPWPS